MKVIIAEKPSVARIIAAIVGATSKQDGYLEGNGYAVTWAFGHLVGLAMPESYGFAGFKRENLPILPKEFILIPRQIKEGKEYKSDPGALKQLKIIKDLFSRADSIIVGTDAGREGELIHRFIYDYVGCNKPCERLWISSLTDKAIREGLQNLKPGSQYDNLYLSAKARSCADWVVGLNASQALSIAAGSGVWSLGRVQTPTLAMICSRYLENKDFKPQTYFRLKLHTTKDATTFAVLSADKYDSRTTADEMMQRVQAAGTVRVTDIERKEVKQEPPLLYDLTTLQKEANSKHGFSAEKTLNIAQALYEAKKISYPRTGSRYISADVMDEIPQLIATLKAHPRFGTYAEDMENIVLNIRSVDDKKVTDHHALIITGEDAGGLTGDERILYDMVAGRMLESFSNKCVKENTAVSMEAGGVHFSARGSVTLVPGWRAVFNHTDEPNEKDEDEPTALPALAEGEALPVREIEVQEKQTKPRPLHTEATLLASMESCGKDVTDEAEREAMKMPSKRGQSELAHNLPSDRHLSKESGIGTPATRAAVIETLFSREYVVREKKTIVPTNKGLMVYLAVKDKKIADVSMTGQWEHALLKIGTGDMDAATFHRSIEGYASQITTELLSITFERSDDRAGCDCPKCSTGKVTFFPKVAKCKNEACGLTVFRSIAGKELSDAQLTDLLTKSKTPLIKGFKSKAGKAFDAYVKLDGDYKTAFEFPQKSGANKSKSK